VAGNVTKVINNLEKAMNIKFIKKPLRQLQAFVMRIFGYKFLKPIILPPYTNDNEMTAVCIKCGKKIKNQWAKNNKHLRCQKNYKNKRPTLLRLTCRTEFN
jgi:hypothetical protein